MRVHGISIRLHCYFECVHLILWSFSTIFAGLFNALGLPVIPLWMNFFLLHIFECLASTIENRTIRQYFILPEKCPFTCVRP